MFADVHALQSKFNYHNPDVGTISGNHVGYLKHL